MSNIIVRLRPLGRPLGSIALCLSLLALSACSLLPGNPGAAVPVATQVSAANQAKPAATQAKTPAPQPPPPSTQSTHPPPRAGAAPQKPTATEAPANQFGLLGELTDRVFVQPSETDQAHLGVFGESLPIGALVNTDQTGRARLLLQNGTTVRMAPNTQITLTDHQQPQSGDVITQLDLLVGKVWAILGRGASETLTVETPIGVGAVRGSYMSVEYAPGKPDDPSDDVLIVTCLEGNCSVTNDTGTVNLTTGQKAIIEGKGGPISGPNPMTQEDVNDWLNNNPEILILFSITNGQGPASLGPITIQLPGGGFIVVLPPDTETPTPTPTATPTGGGGSTLPTAAPGGYAPWPNTLGSHAGELAVVFFGLVFVAAGRETFKRRK